MSRHAQHGRRRSAERTPILLRATLTVALVAALATSVARAQTVAEPTLRTVVPAALPSPTLPSSRLPSSRLPSPTESGCRR